jgi:ribosomal-protein-alanine N-acetyltransferase
LNNRFQFLKPLNLTKGKSWPDEDVLETLPRIFNNLSKVAAPTGFESWMIIKKDTREIIGDSGFKGYNFENKTIDIGYGIIKEERRNGYAEEAVVTLINWAFSTEIVEIITASCFIDNVNSIHLLSKLDFKLIDTKNEIMYWKLNCTK